VHRFEHRRASSGLPSPHKTRGSSSQSNNSKQHTYTINLSKITSMRDRTRIVAALPGVNDVDVWGCAKTANTWRASTACCSLRSAKQRAARRRRGCCSRREKLGAGNLDATTADRAERGAVQDVGQRWKKGFGIRPVGAHGEGVGRRAHVKFQAS
jgi:hypothetical protein